MSHRHRCTLRAARNIIVRVNVEQQSLDVKLVRRRTQRIRFLHPGFAVERFQADPEAVPIEAVVDPGTIGK